MKSILILALLTLPLSLAAQVIDNTPSYETIHGDTYLRINYDNDFFSAKDEYYTQGINIELASPFFKANPLNRLFPVPSLWQNKYGVAIEHDGYTPTDIGAPNIQYGDRPFAATLQLKAFKIANARGHRLSYTLSMGIVGPAAMGKEMQTGIHEWTHGVKPLGWANQIKNDIILNYQLHYERKLLGIEKFFLLNVDGAAKIGTLTDNVSIGTNAIVGYFNDPFSDNGSAKMQVYIYDKPSYSIVGFDATLQGGLFSKSPYTIPTSDISSLVFCNRFGAVFSYKSIMLEYFQTYIGKEIETAKDHKWGGIQLAFLLK